MSWRSGFWLSGMLQIENVIKKLTPAARWAHDGSPDVKWPIYGRRPHFGVGGPVPFYRRANVTNNNSTKPGCPSYGTLLHDYPWVCRRAIHKNFDFEPEIDRVLT